VSPWLPPLCAQRLPLKRLCILYVASASTAASVRTSTTHRACVQVGLAKTRAICISCRREGAADDAGGDTEAPADEPRDAVAADPSPASAEQLEEQEQLRQAALDKLQGPKQPEQTDEVKEDAPADVAEPAPAASAE
jgi:hypothetical protein